MYHMPQNTFETAATSLNIETTSLHIRITGKLSTVHSNPQSQHPKAMALHCPAVDNPVTIWPHMCPSLGAAYLYAVLFGLTTIAHVVQMFQTRKPYCWVIAFSGGLQTAAYILRIISIKDVTNTNIYSDWFILMMVAPIWTNAYAYMVMGRMVFNFTTSGSVYKIKAWHFGLIFVLLDIFAFFVQVVGAAIASATNNDVKLAMVGSEYARFHVCITCADHCPD